MHSSYTLTVDSAVFDEHRCVVQLSSLSAADLQSPPAIY